MKFHEIEGIIKKDGWKHRGTRGSHYQYVHPDKPGKVTIPHHGDDIDADAIYSILKQAGLKEKK